MEGMGSSSSRLGGRSSSRYGPAPPVFNGPVRKWKKEWVHVAPRPPTHAKARKDTCRLLLCKWTPTTSSQPPRRRFRYAPVADVRKLKTDTKENKTEVETSEVPRSNAEQASMADDVYGKLEMFDASIRDTQPTLSSIFGEDDEDVRDLDLDLCMAGNAHPGKQNKKTHVDEANSGRTWLTG
uniref:Uncharacterized protein n=1 Tax=Kalanchoe fedtschenkoi TaxID=63787 RepID=A0A7N0U1J6_KALFE